MRAGLDSGQALKRVAVLVAGAAVGLAACSTPAASAPATAAAPTAAPPSAAAPSTEASGAAASPSVAIVNNRAARDRVPLVRGREQLRRPDAGGGPGRGGGRQREAHGLRRQQRPGHPDQAAPGRRGIGQVRRHHRPAHLRWRPRDRRPGRDHRGHRVGNIDQILGADFTTAAPRSTAVGQRGLRASEMGRKFGELAVKACTDAEPMQRRLHLLGQGVRPRRRPSRRRSTRPSPPIRRSRSWPRASRSTRRRSASRRRRTCSRHTPTSTSSSAPTRRSRVPSGGQGAGVKDKVDSSATAAGRWRSRASRPAIATRP